MEAPQQLGNGLHLRRTITFDVTSNSRSRAGKETRPCPRIASRAHHLGLPKITPSWPEPSNREHPKGYHRLAFIRLRQRGLRNALQDSLARPGEGCLQRLGRMPCDPRGYSGYIGTRSMQGFSVISMQSCEMKHGWNSTSAHRYHTTGSSRSECGTRVPCSSLVEFLRSELDFTYSILPS